jgi:enoyl-CoA hydratase
VSFERDEADGVAVLRLARPPVNALDLPTVLGLERAFGELAQESPRALVVTGGGGIFSAGVDTRAFAAYGHAEKAELVRAITRTVGRIYGLPFPVVAAISGHALGGGLVLALACDHRLALEGEARLGLTEARAGVPFPAGPLEVIRAELSPELLRRLTLTSVVVGPAELRAAGVIDRLEPAERLVPAAVAAANELAAQPAFAVVKRQVRAPALERLAALAASGDDPLIGILARS